MGIQYRQTHTSMLLRGILTPLMQRASTLASTSSSAAAASSSLTTSASTSSLLFSRSSPAATIEQPVQPADPSTHTYESRPTPEQVPQGLQRADTGTHRRINRRDHPRARRFRDQSERAGTTLCEAAALGTRGAQEGNQADKGLKGLPEGLSRHPRLHKGQRDSYG